MHTSTPRRAFTLVELMVVIGIIATLMVLLLPAVNSAVESGRRTKCVANQTKLALAMAMYDSRNNFLPGVRNKLQIKNGPMGPPPDISTPGWFIMLLPLLERQDLLDAVIDGKITIYTGAYHNGGNNSFLSHSKGLALDLTACPSAGGMWNAIRPWYNMAYRANCSSSSPSSFNVDDGAIGDNANGIYSSAADIAAADGTSSTLLITEDAFLELEDSWYPKTVASGTAPTNPGAVYSGPLWFWPKIEAGGGHLFGFSGTPTATTKIVNSASTNLPSSVHPGGAVSAFADGSTRFLRETLMPHVYGHLLTRRSVWQTTTTGTYANNSGLANGFLQCPPATKPYTLKVEDY
ncbi:MAG: DUF1559 domain-containing protein [Planctomycetaceae bacterium]